MESTILHMEMIAFWQQTWIFISWPAQNLLHRRKKYYCSFNIFLSGITSVAAIIFKYPSNCIWKPYVTLTLAAGCSISQVHMLTCLVVCAELILSCTQDVWYNHILHANTELTILSMLTDVYCLPGYLCPEDGSPPHPSPSNPSLTTVLRTSSQEMPHKL